MYKKYFKRLLDILISILAMPVFLILLLIFGPIIYFSDKGTIFYNSQRLGKDGKVFIMYKFRSMKMNVPDLRNEDGSTYNSEKDIRLTKIGKFLRKTSFDEIPQILNVIKGDMSIVGPRPDMPDALLIYDNKYNDKLSVKPGITGLNQVLYRNTADLQTRFQNDVSYTKDIRFLVDLKIIIKTIFVVTKRKNIFK